MKLALVQASLRREWQLRHDGEVVATLRLPFFRRRAEAEAAGRRLAIERRGIGAEHVVRDAATQERLARLRPEGRRRVLEVGDRTAEWRRPGRKEGHGFVGPDGEPLLRAKVSAGLMRTHGEVEVAEDVPEHEALVLAVLASFLLIRKAEDESAAAASSATVANSS